MTKIKSQEAAKGSSPTRERILVEAMRLFAERGYERTSVGDIQEAAGLTFGSGALYKHFPSKQAVLEAGLEEFIEKSDREQEAFARLPEDPRDAFHYIGEAVLAFLASDRDTLRIVWRELEQFPDLREEVRGRRIQRGFKNLAAWLRKQADEGRVREHDPEAVAAVILGSLVFYRLMEALMGETPGRVGADRFARAWLDLVVNGLSKEARKKG